MGNNVTSDGDYEMAVIKERKAMRIFAFGDLWLSNPGSNSIESITKSMAEQYDVVVYSLTSTGWDTSESLSEKPLKTFLKKFEANQKNKGFVCSRVLISAGGMDILEKKDFRKLLRENPAGGTVQEAGKYVDEALLAEKMKSVAGLYGKLLEKLVSLNSEVKVMTHNYSAAAFAGKGNRVLGLPAGGNWIAASFDEKKIRDENIRKEIFRHLFKALGETLLSVQKKYPSNLRVIDTQKIIEPGDWKNETQLNNAGFAKIAREIYNEGIAGR